MGRIWQIAASFFLEIVRIRYAPVCRSTSSDQAAASAEEEPRDGWRIAEGKNRSVAPGERDIAGDGDDIVLLRPKRRLAEFGPMHFDLFDRGRLEAFREIEIGRCHAGEQGSKIRFGGGAVQR